jgi:hypothetical protein
MTANLLFAKARLRTRPASAYRLALATGLLLAAAGAQAADASCITAGRLDADGRWAPQFQTVRLLDEAGRALPTRTRADLSRVRGVEITQPALLSTCEGERALTRGEDTATAKAPVPAAKPGRLAVDGVGFPKLQSGGELVELKVQVPPDRVVMITR